MPEPLRIIVSNRRTLGLEVNDRSEIIVRAPHGLDERTIRQFVESKARWIKKQLAKFLGQGPRINRAYSEGELLLFLGTEYPLHIVPEHRPFHFKDGFFLPDIQRHRAREVVIGWYKKEAKKRLQERTARIAVRHGLIFQSMRITSAITRWGSCGHQGTLNFSWRIIMAPLFVIDYVISHELAHLTIKNHGPRFWRRVEEICPDYSVAHQWLKDHGSRLKL